jgi:hypothetical protein
MQSTIDHATAQRDETRFEAPDLLRTGELRFRSPKKATCDLHLLSAA